MNRTDENLTTAYTHTTGEISRTDAKATGLLTLHGLLVAGLSLLDSPCTLSVVLAVIGGVALVLGVVGGVLVLRPRIPVNGGSDRANFGYWATASAADIEAAMTEDRRIARIQALSCVALRKMRMLRLSADATLAAVAAIAAAILVG